MTKASTVLIRARSTAPLPSDARTGRRVVMPQSEHDKDIPATLEAVLDHEWLGEVLDDVASDERIVAVEQIDSTKTLAQKVRFRATVESSDGRRRTKSYCVKAHLDGSPGNDLFSEARFYRELAPFLDVRMPGAYYTGINEDAAQAMIIMDDVVDMGGQFLSAHSPYSLETTQDSLSQLALLHASTWDCGRTSHLEWLSPRIRPMTEFFSGGLLQSLLDDGRGPGIAPELRRRRQPGRSGSTYSRPRDHLRDPRRYALWQRLRR